ncbi:phosphoribosyltransferase [Aminobacter carboxidus]|uniref:Adenine/guanine phosphoribosyltransferase-like PRPP-binding protein n=1 Tax=Aminobacter carboxidus TaxID=376165 RepID=A0A8E1WCZ7_9HYPH|nr:phosphoribosyltransferase [Aminobacter lissarensis]MBB6466112.1 adenine/guanine phosphoribosyltransferase-like PRPP-binding protein [Aminobacter lissarensis]
MPLAPHQFWQTVYPEGTFETQPADGFSDLYPASLPDGRQIALPIRILPGDGTSAVASMIVNQASFTVEDALSDAMAVHARAYDPEVVIGVPTLGLPLANGVARRLGHSRMVALGTSRKFWYSEDLSEPMSSITSPDHAKRLYLDPRMLPLLEGKRVLVVDDVISSGTSMLAVLKLLEKAGIEPVAAVFAMLQGDNWRQAIGEHDAPLVSRIHGAIVSPRLRLGDDGDWWPSAS